jgi:cupin 2 domain-containing protein
LTVKLHGALAPDGNKEILHSFSDHRLRITQAYPRPAQNNHSTGVARDCLRIGDDDTKAKVADMQDGNLYENAAPPADGERFETLLAHKGLHIERIVSSAKIESHEYVQEQDEWVVLLQGEATLNVAGTNFVLKSGDYLFIPSQTPHTVMRVSQGALWLAVHLR